MLTFSTDFRIRYGETDQMGVVYHANYATYFEVARTEWLRQFGITYKTMEANGIMLPVVVLSIQYKKPAMYDDMVSVKTSLKKIPTASIAFDYEMYNAQHQLLATAYTKLAFINKTTNRPTRCPDDLLNRMAIL